MVSTPALRIRLVPSGPFLRGVIATTLTLWLLFALHLLPQPVSLRAGGQRGNANKRFVFIDVGGNVGDSVAAFLKAGIPDLPRPAASVDAIYVFEPNPAFASRFHGLEHKPFTFQLLRAAASAEDGTLQFGGKDLGGSTLSGGGDSGQDGSVTVKAIDFSAWLAATVTMEDYVVCKIDAEGSEYEIMQRMIVDGTLCLCDRFSVEWHGWLGAPNDAHLLGFNNPAHLVDRFDAPVCINRNDCVCHIPHLQRQLPYFYCNLPRMVQWARAACRPSLLLENHELWWDRVGQADALQFYGGN